jgi:hypothetical protein
VKLTVLEFGVSPDFFTGAVLGAVLFCLILAGIEKMSDTASKDAQKAYIDSLYRMTYEQLVAEVMRVHSEAHRLITEISEENSALLAKIEELETE